MNNEIKIFEHAEFGRVRSVVIDGEPWLVGKDVAEALGYSNASKAVMVHVDDEDKRFEMLRVSDSQNGNLVKTVLINESGIYALILSSKLPSAKKFKRWVTSDVLPSIRKNGGYFNGQRDMTPEELMASALIVAQNVIKEKDEKILALEETVESQKQTIEDYQPKVEYLDTILSSQDAVTTTQIAADYDISANRLNKILHEEGLQRKVGNQWILYHKHMGKGYTKSETIQIEGYGTSKFVMHTKWTQKGRLAIYNILKSRGMVPVMDRNKDE